jgi:hypothetical protein
MTEVGEGWSLAMLWKMKSQNVGSGGTITLRLALLKILHIR